ncbi:MAG: transposase [Chloroflexi bacterium]|nr:transposase [Chloroflexota bacterium]
MQQIANEDLDCLPDMIRGMLNTAIQAERQTYLGAGRYERNHGRKGHANGYKGKIIETQVGNIIQASSVCHIPPWDIRRTEIIILICLVAMEERILLSAGVPYAVKLPSIDYYTQREIG